MPSLQQFARSHQVLWLLVLELLATRFGFGTFTSPFVWVLDRVPLSSSDLLRRVPGGSGVVRPLIVALTYVAVGELFGGVPNPDSHTYVAVGELFGGSLATSVLLQELVEFGGG